MEQAQDLIQWGELEQADKLALLAADQRVTFGPFDPSRRRFRWNDRRPAASRTARWSAARPTVGSPVPAGLGPSQAARQRPTTLMRQIRRALAAGQIDQAEFMCRQIGRHADSRRAFAPGEDTPGRVFEAFYQAKARYGLGRHPGWRHRSMSAAESSSAVYDPSRDRTRNMQVADIAPDAFPSPPDRRAGRRGRLDAGAGTCLPGRSPGYTSSKQGEEALKAHDRDRAWNFSGRPPPIPASSIR